MRRALLIAALLSTLGCEGLTTTDCADLGIEPSCKRVGDVRVCPQGAEVCHDLEVRYSCQDHGGTLCKVK